MPATQTEVVHQQAAPPPQGPLASPVVPWTAGASALTALPPHPPDSKGRQFSCSRNLATSGYSGVCETNNNSGGVEDGTAVIGGVGSCQSDRGSVGNSGTCDSLTSSPTSCGFPFDDLYESLNNPSDGFVLGDLGGGVYPVSDHRDCRLGTTLYDDRINRLDGGDSEFLSTTSSRTVQESTNRVTTCPIELPEDEGQEAKVVVSHVDTDDLMKMLNDDGGGTVSLSTSF